MSGPLEKSPGLAAARPGYLLGRHLAVGTVAAFMGLRMALHRHAGRSKRWVKGINDLEDVIGPGWDRVLATKTEVGVASPLSPLGNTAYPFVQVAHFGISMSALSTGSKA